MSVNKVIRATSPVAMALLLASCGGAMNGTDSGAGTEPLAGSANGVTDLPATAAEENSGSGKGTTISGRVADGYIQGATVCVDMNNNDSCDDDEPSAVTGAGGLYDLNIPANAQDKPIVADIPAEAIDEDTGEAVGKPLVFIAPADQPEFISPITTLIHQELQINPSLNVEDAENSVKSLLGISGEDVSLFTDYVAGGRKEDLDMERQEKFRYLHDTARVVTSMMKDIEAEMESAAQSNGVDVVGSEDTKRAIRDIVRREVRQLLPDIAQQVADSEHDEEATDLNPGADVGVVSQFDPEKIALALRPEGISEDVQERIDAVIDRVDPVQADIKQLLTDGFYTMEFECSFDILISETVPASALPDLPKLSDEVKVGDDGKIHDNEMRNCQPYYGYVRLNDAGDELISQSYYFNSDTGAWIEYDERNDDGNGYSEFVLVDGEWQKLTYSDSGPKGKVEFTSDNSAVINDAEGKLQVKAVTQSLDSTNVKKYLLSDVVDPVWFDFVQATDMFPSGSRAHVISAKHTAHPYVLFNSQPYADSGEATCAEYFDNCNVIGDTSLDQFNALLSLREVREGSVQGIDLASLHSGIGPGATMTFMENKTPDGTLPTSGTVKWSFGYEKYDETQYAPDGEYFGPDAPASFPVGGVDIDGCYPIDKKYEGDAKPAIVGPSDLPDGESEPEFPAGPGSLPEPGIEGTIDEQDPDNVSTLNDEPEDVDFTEFPIDVFPSVDVDACADLAAQTGEGQNSLVKPMVNEQPTLSRWTLVEVDGVEMIEIQLPDELRYGDDNVDQAILLAEHNGFVRLGARANESFIDRVATYNETAFTLLRSIVESGAVAK